MRQMGTRPPSERGTSLFHTLPVSEEKGKSAAAGSGAADFFDERRGRIALQQGEAYDFTAAPLHRFPAYDADPRTSPRL